MIELRPAAERDLDGIVEVFRACWTHSYAAFATDEELARLDERASRHMWAGALAGGGVSVAVEGDKVCGILRHSVEGDRVDVHSLYVDPRWQSGGLGTRLLEHARADGARRGAVRGRLWVFADNAASRAFYASRGWLPDGVTRTQDAFGLPEVRLAYADTPGSLSDAAEWLCSKDILLSGEFGPAGVVLAVDGAFAVAGDRGPGLRGMTLDTWFDLASVTKLVTTCCLMTLASRGAVRLDDPVSRWVPEVEGATVRDLLHHRGGFVAWQPLYVEAHCDADAAMRVLAAIPRQEAPAGRVYSDLGFMVLGAVVAAAFGASLDEAVDALLARPLGLDLAYRPRGPVAASALDDRIERRMVEDGNPYPVTIPGGFDGWRTGLVVGEPNDGNAQHAFGGVAGHAGCFATVPALHSLGAALANAEEHADLWRPDVVAAFLAEGPEQGQAAGFRTHRLSDGRIFHHHPGFTGCVLGFVADPIPERRHVVAIGANRLVSGQQAEPGAELRPVPTQRLRDVVLAATLEAR
ncbi:GNAT family N-acetyltransferase [Mariniluteicoccus flavus]